MITSRLRIRLIWRSRYAIPNLNYKVNNFLNVDLKSFGSVTNENSILLKNVAKVLNFDNFDIVKLRKLEAQRQENARISHQAQLDAVMKGKFFNENMDQNDTALEKYDILLARQRHMESCQSENALHNQETLIDNMSRLGRFSATKRVQRLLLSWYEPFSKALQDELHYVKQGRQDKGSPFFSALLLLMPHYEIATIVVNRAINAIVLSGNLGAPVRNLCVSIHEELTKHMISIVEKEQAKANAALFNNNNKTAHSTKKKQTDASSIVAVAQSLAQSRSLMSDRYTTKHSSSSSSSSTARGIISRIQTKDSPWDEHDGIVIAARLLDLLIRHAVGQLLGATCWSHIFVHDTIIKSACPTEYVGIIRFDGDFYKELKSSSSGGSLAGLLSMDLQYLPMLIPPNSWMTAKHIGRSVYLSLPTELLRAHCRSQVEALNRLYKMGTYISSSSSSVWSDNTNRDSSRWPMFPVISALDYLGSVPWKINVKMMMIVKEAWRLGLVIGHVPSQADLPLPVEPIKEKCVDVKDYKTRMNEYRLVSRRIKRRNAELHSLRCDFLIKFGIAQTFANEGAIYFPQNLDFRGRAYPIPQNLNHMSDDVCRGLLTFTHAKPLGDRGMYWLKVHLANLFGISKKSLADRVAWVDERIKMIMMAARFPLGRYSYDNTDVDVGLIDVAFDWWKSADDPFQALATCIEINNAMACPDPSTYLCSLPIHQDGSCNGLQHYAALGRDVRGASQVNLINGVKPNDVYSEVCALVKSKVLDDIASGDTSEEIKIRAKFILPYIDRRTVKQTVMTSVYGVTLIGSRQQIESKVNDRFISDVVSRRPASAAVLTDDEESLIYFASLYLAGITINTIGQVFSSSKLIMDWLSACATVVASCGHVMSWTTPLGLPVCQPYRREKEFVIRTQLQTLQLFDSSDSLPVSSNRQKSAFPPNFIHSLDSTHMMMTALKMKKRGIVDFAAVHDSYWSLACDVDDMNVDIRTSFFDLYSQPILDTLLMSLKMRFPQALFPPVPPVGELDLNLVKSSTYLFS